MLNRPPGLNRRQLLARIGAASAATLAARVVSAERGAASSAARPPRYWVQIVPAGGIDAVYTTDAREVKDVAPGVDVPYRRDRIVETKTYRLGPHLAGLAAHADRLVVFNGLLVKAANHYTGLEQITRLRTSTTPRTPSCLDIVGAHRDGQAVGHTILGAPIREGRTPGALADDAPGMFGAREGLFSQLEGMSSEEMADVAAVLGTQIASLKRQGDLDAKDRQMLDALGQSRALFERWSRIPPLKSSPWHTGIQHLAGEISGIPGNLQRALWMLEHDLACTITIFAGGLVWDTHAGNDKIQSFLTPMLASSVSRFLDELKARRNRHGLLADQTAVMVTSELGRFPYLNKMNGKDHFPQISAVFAGPDFGAGRMLGGTGRELEALPISLTTGRPDPRGTRAVLDDLGVTTLAMAGIDPLAYGVTGRSMDFLRAESVR